MQIEIKYTEKELKQLIINDIMQKLDLNDFDEASLDIQVKSKQNYKSEWEKAEFKAKYSHYKA